MRLCARGLCDRKARRPSTSATRWRATSPTWRSIRRAAPACTARSASTSPTRRSRRALRGDRRAPPGARRGARARPPSSTSRRRTPRATRTRRSSRSATTTARSALLPPATRAASTAHEALEAIFRVLGRRRERRTHLDALRRWPSASGQARWVASRWCAPRASTSTRATSRAACRSPSAPPRSRACAKHAALEVEAQTILSEILRELGDVQGALDAVRARAQGRARPAACRRARAPRCCAPRASSSATCGRVREAVEALRRGHRGVQGVGARRSEARAKNALAYAMFVLERFEDAIAARPRRRSRIDLAIGGRFQIAKTLSNIGQAYARLGDMARGLAYLKRARDAHERYGDQDCRADTLLCTAEVLLEAGDVDAAHTLARRRRRARRGHRQRLRHRARAASSARCWRARAATPGAPSTFAAEARQLAEAQGLVGYHVYATAIEAAARVDAGELHTGVLLRAPRSAPSRPPSARSTASRRAPCCEALRKGAPESARDACMRAAAHVRRSRLRARPAPGRSSCAARWSTASSSRPTATRPTRCSTRSRAARASDRPAADQNARQQSFVGMLLTTSPTVAGHPSASSSSRRCSARCRPSSRSTACSG